MANVKTYKMEPETSEKLQKICEELNLTWDGTFQTLANLYMQQKAIGALPERGMEVKEFQSLLNRVSEAFTYALTVNADAEERKKELMAKNEMNGLMFKMEDDPRITKVGKFIRKT